MTEPSDKAPELTNFLESIAGRSTSIKGGKCIDPPFGCGKLIKGFRDSISAREYTISGLCQDCQDSVFGGGDEEE